MAVQSSQLFGYGVEAEDIVVRRVSRRVSRYIESLNALGPALMSANEPAAASPDSIVHDKSLLPLSQASLEFSDEVPTLVLRGRQDAGKVTEETPTSVAPAVSLPPVPTLVAHDVEEPTLRLPSSRKVDADARVAQPGPPPLPAQQRPKAASQPVAAAVTVKSEAAKPVALRERAKKEPSNALGQRKQQPEAKPVAPVLPPISARPTPASSPFQESPDANWKPLASPALILAAIVGLSVLLAALVYFLLTFNKFVY